MKKIIFILGSIASGLAAKQVYFSSTMYALHGSGDASNDPAAFITVASGNQDGHIIDVSAYRLEVSQAYQIYLTENSDMRDQNNLGNIWNPTGVKDLCQDGDLSPSGLLTQSFQIQQDDLQGVSFQVNISDAFNPNSPNYILGRGIVMSPIDPENMCSLKVQNAALVGVLGISYGQPELAKIKEKNLSGLSMIRLATSIDPTAGIVEITPSNNGLTFKGEVKGLSSSTQFWIVIRQQGDLTGLNFDHTGYSIESTSMQCSKAGVLGSFKTDSSGAAKFSFDNSVSMPYILGRAIVIQKSSGCASNGKQIPAVAGGVIGRITGSTIPTPVPPTQSNSTSNGHTSTNDGKTTPTNGSTPGKTNDGSSAPLLSTGAGVSPAFTTITLIIIALRVFYH